MLTVPLNKKAHNRKDFDCGLDVLNNYLRMMVNQLQKKHSNAHSAGLIARLAVDKRYSKQGYGEWLLIDTLRKLLLARDPVAFPLVVVDSKDGGLQFYKKLGFQPFIDMKNKLFMTIEDIRKSFSN